MKLFVLFRSKIATANVLLPRIPFHDATSDYAAIEALRANSKHSHFFN